MRYLGLDLGTKTLGIAISDRTNTLSSPLKTLRFNNEDYESIIPELLDIIKNNEITDIALGLPKNMDNSLGFASDRSINFKNLLTKHIDIPITLVDERLSSVEANNILMNLGHKNEKRKKIVDEVAAVIILENYIKMRGKDEI